MKLAYTDIDKNHWKVVRTVKAAALLKDVDMLLDPDQLFQPAQSDFLTQTVAVLGDQAVRARCQEADLREFEDPKSHRTKLSLKLPPEACYVSGLARSQVVEPINLKKILKSIVKEDAFKVHQILQRYRQYESHKQKKACSLLSWLTLKLSFNQSSKSHLPKKEDSHYQHLDSQPLIKAYSFNQSGQVIAFLARNDCVYFMDIFSSLLVGSSLFNKRHHKAKCIQFVPGQSHLLAVSGEKGIVIWNLINPSQFFKGQSIQDGKRDSSRLPYTRWLAREGNYSTMTFSASGRYLAAVRNDGFGSVIEVFNLFSPASEPESFDIKRLASSVTYLAFSPLEKYLFISQASSSNTTTFQILALETFYRDTWMLSDMVCEGEVSSTIWSQDEGFLLFHLRGANKVLLLTLNCSKLSLFDGQSEMEAIASNFTFSGQCQQLFKRFADKTYSMKPLAYNMEISDGHFLQEIMATSQQDRLVGIYHKMRNHVVLSKVIAIFKLNFSQNQQCAIIQFVRQIDSLVGTIPSCVRLKQMNCLLTEQDSTQSKLNDDRPSILSYIDESRDSLNMVLIKS